MAYPHQTLLQDSAWKSEIERISELEDGEEDCKMFSGRDGTWLLHSQTCSSYGYLQKKVKLINILAWMEEGT